MRDGRVYGRGATDDKGQFLPLIWAARELAAAGELPVNVRNACEPARIDPEQPVTKNAMAALQRAAGVVPVMVPAGGSRPCSRASRRAASRRC